MVLSPDLKTGTMAALLKEGWIKPCAMDAVKIYSAVKQVLQHSLFKGKQECHPGQMLSFAIIAVLAFIASIIMDSLNCRENFIQR